MRRAAVLSALAATLVAMPQIGPATARGNLRQRLSATASTNPRRTAAATWRGMSEAEKQARAMHFVNQTWKAAGHLYGGGPMPATTFGDTGGAGGLASGAQVTLNPGVAAFLARPKILSPKDRSTARETLLHEWAHHFQNPALRNDSNHAEEAAELFASYWGHRLFGSEGMARQGPLPYANRPAASADLAAAYGPGYWRGGQFQP